MYSPARKAPVSLRNGVKETHSFITLLTNNMQNSLNVIPNKPEKLTCDKPLKKLPYVIAGMQTPIDYENFRNSLLTNPNTYYHINSLDITGRQLDGYPINANVLRSMEDNRILSNHNSYVSPTVSNEVIVNLNTNQNSRNTHIQLEDMDSAALRQRIDTYMMNIPRYRDRNALVEFDSTTSLLSMYNFSAASLQSRSSNPLPNIMNGKFETNISNNVKSTAIPTTPITRITSAATTAHLQKQFSDTRSDITNYSFAESMPPDDTSLHVLFENRDERNENNEPDYQAVIRELAAQQQLAELSKARSQGPLRQQWEQRRQRPKYHRQSNQNVHFNDNRNFQVNNTQVYRTVSEMLRTPFCAEIADKLHTMDDKKAYEFITRLLLVLAKTQGKL